MAANEASRLRTQHAEPRAEEGSAARPLVREPDAQLAHSEVSDADDEGAEPGSEALAALERAAENIRPSWHGAELPSAPPASGPVPAALPPPPALPSFSSFPIEQPAPHYRVDTTVRTAAVLPERLAQLLSQPQIADASHWLRARPWARRGLAAGAVLLLAWWLWPSAPTPEVTAAKPKPAISAPVSPAAPTRSAAPEPAPPAASSEAVAAQQPEPEPPAVAVKKREKRKTAGKAIGDKTAAVKPVSGKPASVKSAPTDVAAFLKPAPGKARKPAKAPAAPTR